MDEVLVPETILNKILQQGRLLETYARFYADGAGHGAAPAVTVRFFEWADTFVGAVLVRAMAGHNVSCSEWRGTWRSPRKCLSHGTWVVTRHWRDGKVVRERVTLRRDLDHVRPMGVPRPGTPPLSMPAHG